MTTLSEQKGVSGLFYVDALATALAYVGPAFCKPINVRIYSAPPPIRYRLVTYELVYWAGDRQPVVDQQWGEAIRYQRPDGKRRFSFTTGTASKSLTLVLEDIRRHSHSITFTDRPLRTAEEGLSRFRGSNYVIREITVGGIPQKLMNVEHVVSIRLDDDRNHAVHSESVKFDLEDPDVDVVSESFPLPYTDNRQLIAQIVDLLNPSD